MQSANASMPMLVTLFGMVTEVSPVQPDNAPSSMLVIPLGIVMDVSPVWLENALAGIDVFHPNSMLCPPPIGPALVSLVQPENAL